jgi:predicted anti-sigma-YlaC factor YlaD
MTVENYLTIYWEAQSAGISAITVYISVLTGYLIIFYIAGEKLSTRQSNFLTMLFVVFSAIPVWGVFEYFSAARKAARAIEKEFLLIGLLDINPSGISRSLDGGRYRWVSWFCMGREEAKMTRWHKTAPE